MVPIKHELEKFLPFKHVLNSRLVTLEILTYLDSDEVYWML